MIKRILLIGLVCAFAQQAAHAQKSVDAEIDALTARVEKLEGTRAVKKLQMAFGYYVDRGLWGDASDLFTDDGTIEIGVDGVPAGGVPFARWAECDGAVARSRLARPVQETCGVA
jgi:hypothetical protein